MGTATGSLGCIITGLQAGIMMQTEICFPVLRTLVGWICHAVMSNVADAKAM